MNLTCGRNPWKRASVTADETFRAFTKDPNFLATILPLSEELNYIIHRIFQLDPANRISLAELRHLIMTCSTFTIPEDEDEDEEMPMVMAAPQETAPTCPRTPAPYHIPFETPITPSSPHDGRATFYKTRGTQHQPPPTPMSPVSQARMNYDSCSSLASNDSLSSHDQKESRNPPFIAGDFLQEPPKFGGLGVTGMQDHVFGHPLDASKAFAEAHYSFPPAYSL